MKRGARMLLAVVVVPVAGAFLLGCPKKVAKQEPELQPKVTESADATRPGATDPAAAQRGAKETAAAKPAGDLLSEEQRAAQLLASRGEDIPIKEPPTMEFVDPADADRGVFRQIYFDYDKSNIRPEFQPVLEGIAAWAAKNPARQLLVEGHCDERGTDEYNLALGERRALAVRRYLVALGLAADRMHTISYGEEKPAVPGSDESAWSKNRRAEFKVSAP